MSTPLTAQDHEAAAAAATDPKVAKIHARCAATMRAAEVALAKLTTSKRPTMVWPKWRSAGSMGGGR